MKALTLHQPWATCIAHHGKRVENRTWAPLQSIVGQRIAIHAGMKLDREACRRLADEEGVELGPVSELPLGAVVATARVVGWARTDGFVCDRGHRTPAIDFYGVTELQARTAFGSSWWVGPIGWVLSTVIRIEPVPCKGAQGLWSLPPNVERLVREREQEAAVNAVRDLLELPV